MATTNVNMVHDNEEKNFFVKIAGLLKVLILIIFPVLKALQFNKYLSMCANIDKDKNYTSNSLFSFLKKSIQFLINTKILKKNNEEYSDVLAGVPIYIKQKGLNLILGIVFSLPLIISLSISKDIISKDIYLIKRIKTVQESKGNLIEKGRSFYFTMAPSIKDDEIVSNRKYYTKVIFTRAAMVIGIGALIQLIVGYAFSFAHPQEEKNKMLRKLLINNGVRRQEDDANMIAFYTPVGVLIDITGSMPTDIIHNDRIWASLNIKINKRDWLNDPKKRSLVFFKTDYELKSMYDYKNV